MSVNKKVLITGASGYLGRYAVKEFKYNVLPKDSEWKKQK